MTAFQHVIFDCDGVLVDSEPLANAIEVALAREAGVTISPEEMARRFIGRTTREQWSELATEHKLKLPDDLEGWVFSRAEGVLRAQLKSIAGVEALLAGLAAPASVASNSTAALVALKLDVTGLTPYFGGRVHSCEAVASPKPAPDLYLHAARMAGVAPGACLVVEDSISGLTAAVRAGAPAIGFTGGSHQGPDAAQRLRAAGAQHVAHDMPSLARILDGLLTGPD